MAAFRATTPVPLIGKGHPIGVSLLFRRGERPDAAAVRALAAGQDGFAIVHEPAEGGWLELLVNGVSFDLAGLSGAAGAELPPERHRFGLEPEPSGGLEAVSLAPGPHLAGGEAMLPVVRSQLALALRLIALPGLVAVAWGPAQAWLGLDYFAKSVTAWLEGGAFPALGLTAVAPTFDGGLQSEGLAFFTGQELRLEPELVEDRIAATRLAVRLINQLVAQGPIGARVEIAGPDGEALTLEPSANGQFVRVRLAA